jgi:hypothetical protein
MLAPMLAMVALVVIVGVNAGPFIEAALEVAAQIVDPAAYVAAVLGPTP